MLSLSTSLINAQYKDIFDSVVKSRFNIKTNRRLDIDEINPYNIYKVVQEGNFIFFIGDENGIFEKQHDKDIFYRAPEDFKFEECLRIVAQTYQRDVEFPYTVPIFINYMNCGGVAACYTGHFSGVQNGKTSTWAGLIIDINIDKKYKVHYTLKDGEYYEYNELYLSEVLTHEIFHCIFQWSWNEKRKDWASPYSWVSNMSYKSSDDLDFVTHFYCGKNAILANAGKFVQVYRNHFSNAFEYTDDKFFAFNRRKNIAVNHLGKVSLGIMKDIGFKLKAGVNIECDKFTGYLFDETEQIWAQVSMGDTLMILEDKWFENGKYHAIWNEYIPTSNEFIKNNYHIDVRAERSKILISNKGSQVDVCIYNIWGKMVDRTSLNTGYTEIEIGSPGIYIVKSGNYSKKVLCL